MHCFVTFCECILFKILFLRFILIQFCEWILPSLCQILYFPMDRRNMTVLYSRGVHFNQSKKVSHSTCRGEIALKEVMMKFRVLSVYHDLQKLTVHHLKMFRDWRCAVVAWIQEHGCNGCQASDRDANHFDCLVQWEVPSWKYFEKWETQCAFHVSGRIKEWDSAGWFKLFHSQKSRILIKEIETLNNIALMDHMQFQRYVTSAMRMYGAGSIYFTHCFPS